MRIIINFLSIFYISNVTRLKGTNLLMKYLILFALFLTFIFPKCIIGDCIDGNGSIEYVSGDSYVGSFKNSLMHGEGEYTFADGSRYTGMFSNNYIHGQGTVIFLNGKLSFFNNLNI